MNKIKMLLGIAFVGGLISTSLVASTMVSPNQSESSPSYTVPKAIKMVAPQNLPPRFLGKTIKVTMLIDENGKPSDIELVYPTDRDLARSLTAVLAKWRFTPALENGLPVSQRVILPVAFVTDQADY